MQSASGSCIIDTAADVFGGNENVRGEVRQFIAQACEKLARDTGAAVVLCAHPSVSGLRSGEGTSGSTAWGNSARSRLYFHRDIDEHGNEADPDLRKLTRKKANFARTGEEIEAYWRDGIFVVADPREMRAGARKMDEKVIREIEHAFDAGRPWSAHHQAGARYVVPWIMEQLKQTKRAAQDTLRRLMAAGEIVETEVDKHTHKNGLCSAKQARNKNAN